MRTFHLLLFLALALPQANAAEPAAGAPTPANERSRTASDIEIFADGPVEYDAASSTIIYRGNVRAKDSQTTLTCDVLTMKLAAGVSATGFLTPAAPTSGKAPADPVESITAEGNVVILQEKGQATGDKAVFDSAANTLTLSGNPKMKTTEGEVTAKRIIFNRTTGNILWEPPFHFKGTAPSAVFSLPGTGSLK
jgi:lipopolysaccharide export system protein LptA